MCCIRCGEGLSKTSAHGTSGILYPWTGSGKMVHTCMYQYVPVQHSIRQYENFTVIRTGMYWYIPVRSFNKTSLSCFLTHPERVRRDKIKVVQLLCMGYNVTKSNFKTAQVYIWNPDFQYMPGIYHVYPRHVLSSPICLVYTWYIHVYTMYIQCRGYTWYIQGYTMYIHRGYTWYILVYTWYIC